MCNYRTSNACKQCSGRDNLRGCKALEIETIEVRKFQFDKRRHSASIEMNAALLKLIKSLAAQLSFIKFSHAIPARQLLSHTDNLRLACHIRPLRNEAVSFTL